MIFCIVKFGFCFMKIIKNENYLYNLCFPYFLLEYNPDFMWSFWSSSVDFVYLSFSSFSSFSMILLFQIRVICNFGCFLRHTRMISCVLPAWEGEAPVTYTPNYCKTSSGMKFLFPEWVLDFLTFVTSNQVSLNLLSLIKTWIKLHLYKNKYVSQYYVVDWTLTVDGQIIISFTTGLLWTGRCTSVTTTTFYLCFISW